MTNVAAVCVSNGLLGNPVPVLIVAVAAPFVFCIPTAPRLCEELELFLGSLSTVVFNISPHCGPGDPPRLSDELELVGSLMSSLELDKSVNFPLPATSRLCDELPLFRSLI